MAPSLSRRAQVALRSGVLCVGAGGLGLFRAGLAAADANGRIRVSPDLTLPPFAAGAGRLTAGSTWHFQCWYRDAAPGGGATSNLSASVAIDFCY